MKSFALALILSCLAVPALAAPCYTDAEAEAEQGIRIHSELMIIGLQCQHRTPPAEKNYYLQYKEFTARHGKLFAGYETTLMDYFKRTGAKNAEDKINSLRTSFANKISGDAARMRPDLFCAHYTPRIATAGKMNEPQLRKWASTFFASHPVSHPVCASAKNSH